MKEEIKKCYCSFCKLRDMQNENTLNDLKWLQERKDKLVRDNQKRNLDLIDLCIKNK